MQRAHFAIYSKGADIMIFQKGEVKKIGIEVISQINQDFVIEGADYKIIKEGTEVESAVATIEGHKILALFSAQEIGKFHCEFTYRIGPEILKAKIYLEVV